jgi:fructosamine-3-kinase
MNPDKVSFWFKQALGNDVSIEKIIAVGGGCINHTHKIVTTRGPYFLKFNPDAPADFFEKEFLNLQLLKQFYPGTIPTPIYHSSDEDTKYLITDFIESAVREGYYWQKLGENLANLHAHTADQFGLTFDNYIGSLPQANYRYENWADFFIHSRLKPQIDRAKKHQLLFQSSLSKFEKLFTQLNGLFPREKPAFIHGDLWSGNLMTDHEGLPALVDPAVYFGHREMELAFTQLFGGFDPIFLQSYQEVHGLEPGYEERFELYNLYPLLVHLNLFGSSYRLQIEGILNRFV